MVKVTRVEDRKKEVEEAKKESNTKKKFGVSLKTKFQGGKEIPVNEPSKAVTPEK